MDRKQSKDAAPSPGGGKYLNIRLGHEAFSLPVLQVREIIRLRPVTPVPRMPNCIKGVINLRGKIVPVVDLRERLQLAAVAYDEHACIVILQAEKSGNVGLIVDRVEDVAHIGEGDIELPPGLGLDLRAEFMMGIANAKEGVKIILNAHRLLDFDALLKPFEDAM